MQHCKNCDAKLTGAFCSQCGQKARIERITFRYILHEIFHFFTHLEKGFLFTSWQMLSSPGKTVKSFIEGKRVKYQSPIPFFLIWTTAYILLLYIIEKAMGENVVINYKEYFGPSATTQFAISHLSSVLIAVIPFQALFMWQLITRKAFNYFETMVVTIYSLGTIILLQSAFALTALPIHAVTGSSVDLRISDLLKVGYLTWLAFDLVKLFPVNLKWLRAVTFLILAFGTFTVWRLYGVPLIYDWVIGKVK